MKHYFSFFLYLYVMIGQSVVNKTINTIITTGCFAEKNLEVFDIKNRIIVPLFVY